MISHHGVKRLTTLLLLFIATSSGCASISKRKIKSTVTIPGAQTVSWLPGQDVIRVQLPNGLKILMLEDHSSPTLAFQVWYKVGSKNEVQGYTGLAHLFEHMMFKATKNLKEGEFDRSLEIAGAEGENAFTTRDLTAYIQEMPSSELDLISRLEAERMVNLIVDDHAFKTEREVVQNERRFRVENNPDGLMYNEIFSLLYVRHPYHWPVIGYDADLKRMSAEDARDFYKSYYGPNNATVVLVGDFIPDQAFATLQKHFGSLKATAVKPYLFVEEKAQTQPRSKTLKLPLESEKLVLAYKVPQLNLSAQKRATLEVLDSIVSGGSSSRLQKTLVDSGIATGIGGYLPDDVDYGIHAFFATAQKGKTASQMEETILKAFQEISNQGVTQEEVDRARNKIKFKFYTELGSNAEAAEFLGNYETRSSSFEYGVQVLKAYDQVTPQMVQQLVGEFYIPNARSTIIALPQTQKAKGAK